MTLSMSNSERMKKKTEEASGRQPHHQLDHHPVLVCESCLLSLIQVNLSGELHQQGMKEKNSEV